MMFWIYGKSSDSVSSNTVHIVITTLFLSYVKFRYPEIMHYDQTAARVLVGTHRDLVPRSENKQIKKKMPNLVPMDKKDRSVARTDRGLHFALRRMTIVFVDHLGVCLDCV